MKIRLAKLTRAIDGKFTHWKEGQIVKAFHVSGSTYCIARLKWKGHPTTALINQCSGIPRSALKFLFLLLSAAITALVCGCERASVTRQHLVETFGTAEVQQIPEREAGFQFIVRDTNGAIWYLTHDTTNKLFDAK